MSNKTSGCFENNSLLQNVPFLFHGFKQYGFDFNHSTVYFVCTIKGRYFYTEGRDELFLLKTRDYFL